MKNNYFKARSELIKMYINSLEEGIIPWQKMWTTSVPYNPVSGTVYKGMNNLILSYISTQRGYEDNRWCTFLNIKKNNWKLVGAEGMGVNIEYVYMYNKKNKKSYSFSEYHKIIKENPDAKTDFRPSINNYIVFNAKHIQGIPLPEKREEKEIVDNTYVNKIIENLGVKYIEQGNEAYYIPMQDTVVVPQAEQFKSTYAYHSTQLHELAHSTGHQSRLNRNFYINFDLEARAKEELRAEISSSFLMQKFGLQYDDIHLENHKAYVQNWLEILKEKPQELFLAIKDANKIVAYIDGKCIDKEQELIQELEEEMEMEY